MPHTEDAEIDRNYEYFQRVVGDFIDRQAGKYALLRMQSVVSFFATAAEAAVAGYEKFPDGVFSIQKVIHAPLDLGFFSHASGQREGR